ncbi:MULTISPECIES: carbohydrate ABC transporter permease [unclassified Paenibacillus]|uniref:carbohydrate ABC transporter permease n=1 Tax=unclassified Paenibacillus TaxID=185978 RepID=UPI002F3F14C4
MKTKANLMNKLFVYLVLIIVSVFIMIPFLWMVITSLKDQTKVFMFPPQWIPNPIVWENYIEVFKQQPFLLYFWNSLYIGVIVTAGTCVLSALAGYAFAKISFPLKNGLFLLLLSGLMIPVEVTIIPLFTTFAKLKLSNSHFPLIVPPMLGAGGAFGVFLMRQFFITVPKEIDEAAKIDGCTPWRIFHTIMLPMCLPAIATLSIFTFLNSWNDFLSPLIYVNSDRLFTLPIGLSMFSNINGTSWHLIMAASVVSALPILIVFFLAQKRFIEGVSLTGIK